ncbi:MAG TPA: Fe-S-containing hydro-lyase [bacterium (Candidatus Stahlbacteria)]|nr:Fe-S-containing hydro-lyase [Candidatus Stahlbacteria bacterium]
MIKLNTPLTDDDIQKLKIGDRVLLNGIIYSARDTAHKRLVELIDKGEKTPIELKGQVIYYVGPAPAKPGYPIGPAGPTTSIRMDPYTPKVLSQGVKGLIGKGNRTEPVVEALKRYKAVYFVAIGGAAALISKRIKSSRVVAYEDLGPEAIREMEVEEFPLIVANDCHGGDLFKEGVSRFKR